MAECDTERIILAVQKHICLWNVGCEDYHDRVKKDLAWEEVCKEIFGEQWDTQSVEEKKSICTEVKKKWNNVRDCFRRDANKIKNAPTGSSAKKQKKYVYADILSFLTPSLETRRHTGNYSNENSGFQEEQNTESEDQNEYITANVPPTSKIENTPRYSKKQDVPTQILNLIKEKRNEQSTQHEDDDEKYLLSFRTELKAMTKSQKIDFKIGMLQLLRKITDPTSDYNTMESASSRSATNSSQRVYYVPSLSPTSNFTNSSYSSNTDTSPSPSSSRSATNSSPAVYILKPSPTSNFPNVSYAQSIDAPSSFSSISATNNNRMVFVPTSTLRIPNPSSSPSTITMHRKGSSPLVVPLRMSQQPDTPINSLSDTEVEYVNDCNNVLSRI